MYKLLSEKKSFLWHFWNRDGKGVETGEDTTPTLKYFFKLFWRRFPRLLSLNLMMLGQVVPLIVAVVVYLLSNTTPTQSSLLFAPLYGISTIGTAPAASVWLTTINFQIGVPIFTLPTVIAYIASALVFILTWGWQQVGATYNLRSMVRHEPVYLASDYAYAVRKNAKQGLLVGMIDAIILLLLGFDFAYFFTRGGSFMLDFMFFTISALIILYALMRPYIYLMLITFDIKTSKIFKNALIFSILGIKRNIMAVLGIVLMAALNVALIILGLSINFAVPIILPFFYFLAFSGFMSAYAVWPVIEKYMIQPFEKENGDGDDSDGDTDSKEDSDDGTASEAGQPA